MGAPLLDLPLVSPSEGLWHQETEAVRVTGTHVVLTGRISQPLSRASLLTTVFDSWINSPPRSKEPKLLKGCACFTLPPIKIYNTKYNISVKVIYFAKYPWQPTWPILKNALYLSVNVFCMEVLIWDTIFMSPTGDGLAILQWSSEPQKTWIHLNDFIHRFKCYDDIKRYQMMQNSTTWKPFPAATGKL